MSTSEFKLAYHARERRVRVEFAAALCFAQETPLADVLTRAKAKLEQEKAAGTIQDFILYEQRLKELWEAVRRIPRADIEQVMFQISIGVGVPSLNGITFNAATDGKTLFNLSIGAPAATTREWPLEWLEVLAQRWCEKQGLPATFNSLHLQSALWRAQRGQAVKNFAVTARVPEEVTKPFRITFNHQRRELLLTIYDGALLRATKTLAELQSTAEAALKKVPQLPAGWRAEPLPFANTFRRLSQGAEAAGLELPTTMILAIALPQQGGASVAKEGASLEKAVDAKPQKDAGEGLLTLTISANCMQASVANWDPARLETPGFKPSPEWVRAEALRQKVVFGLDEKSVLGILKAITSKEGDPNGILLAQGKEPKPAGDAYLHPTYREKSVNDVAQSINLRDAQRLELVKEGDLIAELRFRREPVIGKNVLGQDVPPPPPEEIQVGVGEGVTCRNTYKFYATIGGMPQIDGNNIVVSPTYVHKGDINLKSGNVYFDGDAVIHGSIDHGATVMVSGNLLVMGSIGAALVKAKGTIDVKQGILTTEKGRVQAGSHVNAAFVDNSNIVCGGDLIAQKSVLNSNVIAGGCIDLGPAGVVAGGELSCKDYIKTGKLGFPKGARTVCHVGVDWRKEVKLRRASQRLEKVTRRESEDRLALRELARKTKAQTTKKHQEQMVELQERLKRLRALIALITDKVALVRSFLEWDKNAKIYVHANLVPNVDVEIGGIKIPVKMEVIEAMISTKKYKGEYITSLVPDEGGDAEKDETKEKAS